MSASDHDPIGDHLKKVQALHAHYESLTGNKSFLSYQRIAAWHEYIRRGFTAKDLGDVISFIRREMARPGSGYSPASLQFSRLIQDADLFEDRLNLAREAWRKARPARAATRAVEQHVGDIRRKVELPADDNVATAAEALAQLTEWKKSRRRTEP